MSDSHVSPVHRAAIESLEQRRLLHGGFGGDDPTAGLDPALVQQVRDMVIAGEDVLDFIGTDYDPHYIGVPVDVPRQDGPLQSNGGRSGEILLPDMIPWTGPSGFDYFRDTQLDTFSLPGRSLLRFSTAIANAGEAPVELRGGPITEDGRQTVYQRLYTRDDQGEFVAVEDRTAGEFIYHPQHNHLHFEGYAEYRLLQNVDGEVGGLAQRDDGTTVLGEKVGFCLINITTYDSSIPGYSQSPTGYGCGLRQGISVGRADVYWSGLDSQWIDVTGVPDGEYFIEVTLDADNAIMESDETNNTIQVPVTISNSGTTQNGIQQDRFDNIELNDNFDTATDLGSLGSRIETTLTLHASYDVDFFKFTAASSQTIEIDLQVVGDGDPNMFLYDGQRNELDRSTNPFGSESVTADLVAGETYYLKVDNYQYLDELVGNYALIIDGPVATADVEQIGRGRVTEGQTTTVTVSRNGQLEDIFDVELNFGGTATFGVDYTVDTTTVSFDAESAEKTVEITILKDRFRENPESILISAAGSDAYVVGRTARLWIQQGNPGSIRPINGGGGFSLSSLVAPTTSSSDRVKMIDLMPGTVPAVNAFSTVRLGGEVESLLA